MRCQLVGPLALAGFIFIQVMSIQEINNAYFVANHFHYLNVSKIRTAPVSSSIDCAFACQGVFSCFSYNLAASPDVDGKLWCELLATDKYNAPDEFQANMLFHHFSNSNPCSMAPCKNGGKCIAQGGNFKCECSWGFEGITCENEPLSCTQIKTRASSSTDGGYVIDPDGRGGLAPFTVFCDMSDQAGVGVTVISHDSESRTLVDGCEEQGCYSRDVTYIGASLAQLASLTNVSNKCEQFIKYECFSSAILTYGEGWLVSRDGAKMSYWGGASPESNSCACGLNNTCKNPRMPCNCDANEAAWSEDSGLLTYKSDLPVSQLRFGDTGTSWEKGYHTLGKLKCYGVV